MHRWTNNWKYIRVDIHDRNDISSIWYGTWYKYLIYLSSYFLIIVGVLDTVLFFKNLYNTITILNSSGRLSIENRYRLLADVQYGVQFT
jgi:hypothetical protein